MGDFNPILNKNNKKKKQQNKSPHTKQNKQINKP